MPDAVKPYRHARQNIDANEGGEVVNRFSRTLGHHALTLRHESTQVLQINVGRKCNQTCAHCHVNAGPARTEIMTRHTMDRIIDWVSRTDIQMVDITGGAPEINPNFRYLVERVKTLEPVRHIMDRCNLTILFERGQEDLAQFLAHYQIEIIASLPCYLQANVDAQRGDGVFEKSIRALQLLNALGYGRDENLSLHLVYNPLGAYLPGSQSGLETAYKKELEHRFGIVFNRLHTLVNMPIARFATWLQRTSQLDEYQELLINAFNPCTVAGLMCRTTLNVGWRGEVYDCDFNQMLGLAWGDGHPLYLWDINPAQVADRTVITSDHCFGCTAGSGSSCGGALVQ